MKQQQPPLPAAPRPAFNISPTPSRAVYLYLHGKMQNETNRLARHEWARLIRLYGEDMDHSGVSYSAAQGVR